MLVHMYSVIVRINRQGRWSTLSESYIAKDAYVAMMTLSARFPNHAFDLIANDGATAKANQDRFPALKYA